MNSEARYDPIVPNFVPDLEVLNRGQRWMMEREDELPPPARYVRQHWEQAHGALRVAMDTLREVYPLYSGSMSPSSREAMGTALTMAESAYASLDECAEDVLGVVVCAILKGEILTHEQLDERGVQ